MVLSGSILDSIIKKCLDDNWYYLKMSWIILCINVIFFAVQKLLEWYNLRVFWMVLCRSILDGAVHKLLERYHLDVSHLALCKKYLNGTLLEMSWIILCRIFLVSTMQK